MDWRGLHGLDTIIGAQAIGATGDKYLVLRILDPKGLVSHEKGSGVAWAAMNLVPEYVTDTIYKTVKDQLTQQFKEKGSDVQVDIVTSKPKVGEEGTSDMKGGILVGLLLAALGYGAVKLVKKVNK